MTAVGEELADGLSIVSAVLNEDQQALQTTMRTAFTSLDRATRMPLELAWLVVVLVRELARADGLEAEEWWGRFASSLFLES
ncbi:MAG: hypothetical protein M3N32_07855 [Actinomycetota bacterium]|nr:hypothetical protein [Actinomycetota bacterium]